MILWGVCVCINNFMHFKLAFCLVLLNLRSGLPKTCWGTNWTCIYNPVWDALVQFLTFFFFMCNLYILSSSPLLLNITHRLKIRHFIVYKYISGYKFHLINRFYKVFWDVWKHYEICSHKMIMKSAFIRW